MLFIRSIHKTKTGKIENKRKQREIMEILDTVEFLFSATRDSRQFISFNFQNPKNVGNVLMFYG